ncbi:MAG TPA: apolipoprotein N-acyltransferase [Candidatus Binatia bacterium]|jgi:apolipoprotein N-acyltransferase|nr:apolipoprotein N-acyltransferase [Candidatus Binatia bacterium]
MIRLQQSALAAASGVLLALAFPKGDVSLLAWVAFVPLLWIIKEHTPRRAFIYGWISGMGFYLCTVYWVVHTIGFYSNIPPLVAIGPLLLMCTILALYTGAFAAGLCFYRQRQRSIVLLGPLLWVGLEWLRSFFFIGFPWASLGYSQHNFVNLIQCAEVTGVYGISAVVIFVNLVVFAVLQKRASGRGRLLCAAVLVVFGLFCWGAWRRAQLRALPTVHHLRVGLIQGNIEQDKKWNPEFQEATIARYEQLTREVVARGVDLVIWPETAVPFFFQSDVPYQERLLNLVKEIKTPLLFGSVGWRAKGLTNVTLFNRAYLVSANAEVLGFYDKIQLVPFGEYVPFHDRVLFFLDKLVEGIGDFAAGTTPIVFSLPQEKFGVLICYEGIFPNLARRFVAQGADFLVNITNDAWFGRSSAPYLHLVMEAMRAVENRVPLVRAANTGFSAVVDWDGQVRAQTALYETAFLIEEITWPQVTSFYTAHGDLFAHVCALSALVMLGYGYWQRQTDNRGGTPC